MHDFSCLKALHVLARQLVLESSKTNEEQFLRCSFGTSEKFLDIRSQAAILFKMWQIRDLSRISHTFSRMVNWQSLLNMNPNCQILFITVQINFELKKDKKSYLVDYLCYHWLTCRSQRKQFLRRSFVTNKILCHKVA